MGHHKILIWWKWDNFLQTSNCTSKTRICFRGSPGDRRYSKSLELLLISSPMLGLSHAHRTAIIWLNTNWATLVTFNRAYIFIIYRSLKYRKMEFNQLTCPRTIKIGKEIGSPSFRMPFNIMQPKVRSRDNENFTKIGCYQVRTRWQVQEHFFGKFFIWKYSQNMSYSCM